MDEGNMKINLNVAEGHSPSGENLRRYINTKLRSTLNNSKQYIRNVIVKVSDLKGPKGAMMKICSIQLSIIGQTPVYVKTRARNIYSAISKAVIRAGHKCNRRVRHRQLLLIGNTTGEKKSSQSKYLFTS
ncbi:MAG: ribosome-associated translation inhibitor RaiA [Gammaproteobacteria bacterium]